MSLSMAIVSGRDPVSGQPMTDPIGPFSNIPMEVIRIILQNLKPDLPAIALVCRSWKVRVDDKVFRQMIRPVQAFGTKEWQKYIEVDAGEELPLPRRAYGDLDNDDAYLTFIPDKVKVSKENGVKEVLMDNLEAIDNLLKKPKSDEYRIYSTWEAAIKEKRQEEKPRWVWIKKKVMGRNIRYFEQLELIKEENIKIPGANFSRLIDTALGLFMEFVRSGERNYIWDPAKIEYTAVRVPETTNRLGIWISFSPKGLRFGSSYDDGIDHIGFVCAWRSFGNFGPTVISPVGENVNSPV